MNLSGHIRSWDGHGFRHIPDTAGSNPYDFSFCALSRNNRWNSRGEPTLYLAKDKSVAAGEFSRHLYDNRSHRLVNKIQRRRFWRFRVKLKKTLDLCHPNVCKALSLTGAPFCFEDKQVARSTAGYLRHSLHIEAVFVPSMVFIDDLTKWSLVIFLDNLPENPVEFLPGVQDYGYIEIK